MAETLILDPSREPSGKWPVRNLITNPSMEVNATGWTGWNGAVTRDTINGVRGSFSMKIVSAGGAQQEGAFMGFADMTGQAGKTYSGRVCFKAPATDTYFLQLYGADGGGGVGGTPVSVTAGEFVWLTAEGFTPTLNTRVAFLVNKNTNYAASATMWFDCFMLIEGATIPYEYVDGAQPGCVWEGAANNSISRQSGPVNHIQNPTFEPTGGTAQWQVTAGMTMTASNERAYTGTQSAKLVDTNAGADHFMDWSVAGQGLNITGGVTYTIGAWGWCTDFQAAPLNSRAMFWLSNNAGSTGEIDTLTAAWVGWRRFTITFSMPIKSTQSWFRLYGPKGTIYWDGISMVAETSDLGYFDGSTSPSPADQTSWISTVSNSLSVLIPARSALDINSGAIQVRAADESGGIDWGDADFEPYLADLQRGSVPVDYRLPNRTVTVPLVLRTSGTTTYAQAKAALQQKVALFQAEGGWLKRGSSAGDLYADVVGASLQLPDSWMGANRAAEPNVSLVLTCLPDFYGIEVALQQHSETSNTELIFTESAISGNFPGRCRLVVTEAQGADQSAILAAFRSRYYSAASTAKLAYEAEALTAMDAASINTRAGGFPGSSNVMRHITIGPDWTPVLNSTIVGVGDMTHTGSYRVLVRVYSQDNPANDGCPALRVIWDVGDLLNWTSNDPAQVTVGSAWQILDLGQVTITPAPFGTHRWQFQIQAKKQGSHIDIDKVWLLPVSEAAVITRVTPGLMWASTYISRDTFEQVSNPALSGQTAAIGGAWTKSGSASTVDFTVDSTKRYAKRNTTADASYGYETTATPTALGAGNAQVTLGKDVTSVVAGNVLQGVALRYSAGINAFLGVINHQSASLTTTYEVWKVLSGTATRIATSGGFATSLFATGTPNTKLALNTDGSGYWALLSADLNGAWVLRLSGYDVDLTTSPLNAGKVGIVDYNSGSSATVRYYDSFLATALVADAAVFASRTAQLGTDGNYRLDPAGVSPGKISTSIGPLLRVPPTVEGRTLECFVKASRGDMDLSPADPGIDDIAAQLYYRPSWLSVPG